MKLSPLETKISSYVEKKQTENTSWMLSTKISWQELAQFSNDPSTVKLSTIQKVVSEIKRKYISEMKVFACGVKFYDMDKSITENKQIIPTVETASILSDKGQKLVLFPKHITSVTSNQERTTAPALMNKQEAVPDFVINRLNKSVRTKSGIHKLNDNEWDMMLYFEANRGKLILISELRDQVVFPKYGSKLPARWFDSIMRIVNALRRQVPELNGKLLTVKAQETGYIFQN